MVNLLHGKRLYFTGYRSCGEINYVINPLVENVINLPCSQKIATHFWFLKKMKPIILYRRFWVVGQNTIGWWTWSWLVEIIFFNFVKGMKNHLFLWTMTRIGDGSISWFPFSEKIFRIFAKFLSQKVGKNPQDDSVLLNQWHKFWHFCVGVQSQRQCRHVTNLWIGWCLYRMPSAYPDGVWVARRYLSWNKFSIWIHFMVFDYTQMERPVFKFNMTYFFNIYRIFRSPNQKFGQFRMTSGY